MIEAVVFDAYGTLVSIEGARRPHRRLLSMLAQAPNARAAAHDVMRKPLTHSYGRRYKRRSCGRSSRVRHARGPPAAPFAQNVFDATIYALNRKQPVATGRAGQMSQTMQEIDDIHRFVIGTRAKPPPEPEPDHEPEA